MKNVIVLFGGDSDEKEISKLSADSIIKNIDTSKFNAQLIDLNNLNLKEVDKETVFFIAVHGSGGEDGQIQDLLSKNGYKFTGSDYESTKKCWNKVLSKEILIRNNINTPRYITIDNNENLNLKDDFFSYVTEYFVKPAENGSSLGVSKVSNLSSLKSAVNDAKKYSDQVIIEECYGDAEYTVAILNGIALEPLEILPDPKRSFYDYKAKYLSGETRKVEIIDQRLAEELKTLAIKAFYSHDCNTWGRVDFVTKDKLIGVLEINTVPGFTEKSLVPLAAKKSGINYQQLITEIIEDAF